MKYSFPITANLRSLLPSVERVLSSVEGHFKDFTGESIVMSYQSQIMALDVNTPIPLNSDQIKLVHAKLMPLLIEKFPNCNIEIGEPTITGDPAFDNYKFNAAHRVAQDSSGFDVDEKGERIDTDHNMFLKQDLAAQYGECAKCSEPLTENGTCPGGCTHSEAL